MAKRSSGSAQKKQNLVKLRREKIRAQLGTNYRPSFIQRLPQLFNAEQMLEIIQAVDTNSQAGTIIKSESHTRSEDEIRRSRICWLDRNQFAWLYDSMWEAAKEGNKLYGYEIKPIKEDIQVSVYDESQQGFYTWHMDVDPDFMSRKISISVPLNHPDLYEGGELEFWNGGSVVAPDQKPGFPILFPSWIVHRVNPVTKGRRYSVVCWVSGPDWT